MRLGFFLREALRAMRRNAAPSFAALATVLVTMLVVGVFIPAVLGSGLVILGVQTYWQSVAVGAVLVAMLAILVEVLFGLVERLTVSPGVRAQQRADEAAWTVGAR